MVWQEKHRELPPAPIMPKRNPMHEYDQYERQAEAIRANNRAILEAFESWLSAQGLAAATVGKHVANIDFYINEFLLYADAHKPEDGVDEVGAFLGYWFIRKALWANEASIRSNAASLKKFYDFMVERGSVTPAATKAMKHLIKESMPEWVATMRRYDDPAVDAEDVWQW